MNYACHIIKIIQTGRSIQITFSGFKLQETACTLNVIET